MTDPAGWQARSPLAGEKTWSTVADAGRRGVAISETVPGRVLGVTAYAGARDAVRAGFRAAAGVDAPDVPRRVAEGTRSVVWSGPSQWLVIDDAGSGDLAGGITAALEGIAAVTDQTAARVFLRLGGADVRRALAKVVGVDLHPQVFGVGHVAMTDLAHMAVHLWRLPDMSGEAVFEIAGARSTAGSLWHALLAATAEYGVEASPSS